MVNPSTRETFIMRSRIITYIRHFLDTKGFLEVGASTVSIYGV